MNQAKHYNDTMVNSHSGCKVCKKIRQRTGLKKTINLRKNNDMKLELALAITPYQKQKKKIFNDSLENIICKLSRLDINSSTKRCTPLPSVNAIHEQIEMSDNPFYPMAKSDIHDMLIDYNDSSNADITTSATIIGYDTRVRMVPQLTESSYTAGNSDYDNKRFRYIVSWMKRHKNQRPKVNGIKDRTIDLIYREIQLGNIKSMSDIKKITVNYWILRRKIDQCMIAEKFV